MKKGDLVKADPTGTPMYCPATERLIESFEVLLYVPHENDKRTYVFTGFHLQKGETVVFLEREDPSFAKVLTQHGVLWCDITELSEIT